MVSNGFSSVVTIYRYKKMQIYSLIFLSNNFFPKSKKGNEIWTFLRMSKIGNPKKVLKTHHFSLLHHNGHNYFFCLKFL
jgi:hypothetical protein